MTMMMVSVSVALALAVAVAVAVGLSGDGDGIHGKSMMPRVVAPLWWRPTDHRQHDSVAQR